ncbi:MAG: hypothetical protein LLG00_01295 [Planctomycetaceae bacterium]|nr:hypothetical protein [Planctomycetaceae bacterium]
MTVRRLVQAVAVSLAALGVCVPELAFAAEQPKAPAVVDIALADGGVLQGQVVDLQGGQVGKIPVSVKAQNREVAQATTTPDGHFSVQGLRGGVYQVAAGDGQGVYRLWAANTAPSAAQKGAIVYTQNAQPRSTAKMLLTNPIVIAGVVATAIAVPVALANSHSSSP